MTHHNNGKAQTLYGLDQSQPRMDELKPAASFPSDAAKLMAAPSQNIVYPQLTACP